MSILEPTAPPALDEVPPADAAAPPRTLLDTPGTAFMPVSELPERRALWPDCTSMPCVVDVFCEAEVDWSPYRLCCRQETHGFARRCIGCCTRYESNNRAIRACHSTLMPSFFTSDAHVAL